MNLRAVLPIEDVKEIGGGAVLFQNVYLHYLAETSAKEAHWSLQCSRGMWVLLLGREHWLAAEKQICARTLR